MCNRRHITATITVSVYINLDNLKKYTVGFMPMNQATCKGRSISLWVTLFKLVYLFIILLSRTYAI